MWTSSGQYPTGTRPTEESGPLAEIAPLTKTTWQQSSTQDNEFIFTSRRDSISQGMMRTLEFESHSKVAAQREGFEKDPGLSPKKVQTFEMKNTASTTVCTRSIKMKDPP